MKRRPRGRRGVEPGDGCGEAWGPVVVHNRGRAIRNAAGAARQISSYTPRDRSASGDKRAPTERGLVSHRTFESSFRGRANERSTAHGGAGRSPSNNNVQNTRPSYIAATAATAAAAAARPSYIAATAAAAAARPSHTERVAAAAAATGAAPPTTTRTSFSASPATFRALGAPPPPPPRYTVGLPKRESTEAGRAGERASLPQRNERSSFEQRARDYDALAREHNERHERELSTDRRRSISDWERRREQQRSPSYEHRRDSRDGDGRERRSEERGREQQRRDNSRPDHRGQQQDRGRGGGGGYSLGAQGGARRAGYDPPIS